MSSYYRLSKAALRSVNLSGSSDEEEDRDTVGLCSGVAHRAATLLMAKRALSHIPGAQAAGEGASFTASVSPAQRGDLHAQ